MKRLPPHPNHLTVAMGYNTSGTYESNGSILHYSRSFNDINKTWTFLLIFKPQ